MTNILSGAAAAAVAQVQRLDQERAVCAEALEPLRTASTAAEIVRRDELGGRLAALDKDILAVSVTVLTELGLNAAALAIEGMLDDL